MFVTVKPRFQDKPLSKEVSEKIDKSYNETVDMKFRPIFCPYCGWHVVDVFDDIVGHIAIKCNKCKATIPINAAYFHRSEYLARLKRAKLRGEIPED